jgi:hypothetical protein
LPGPRPGFEHHLSPGFSPRPPFCWPDTRRHGQTVPCAQHPALFLVKPRPKAQKIRAGRFCQWMDGPSPVSMPGESA